MAKIIIQRYQPRRLRNFGVSEEWSYSHWDPPTINRASLEKYSKIPAFRVCFRFCCTAICCQPQFHLLPHLPAFHPNSTTFHGHLGHHWNLALMQSQGFQASEVETKRSISQCLMLPASSKVVAHQDIQRMLRNQTWPGGGFFKHNFHTTVRMQCQLNSVIS